MDWLRRVFWRATRSLSTSGRSWSWDDQFKLGRWDHIRVKDPNLVERVVKLVDRGKLVELGCGEAVILSALPGGAFSEYVGVDISRVAIERARERALAGCRFEVCDLEHWQGESGAALVMIEECLYYLTRASQDRLLRVALESVAPSGAVLVAMHDRHKHAALVERVVATGKVVANEAIGSRVFLTLRPGPGEMS